MMSWYRMVAMATALILGALSLQAVAAERLQVLLLTGLGNTDAQHPYRHWHHEFYNDVIVETLAGVASVTVTDDLSVLNPKALAGYQVIVANSMFLEGTDTQRQALFDFIRAGGGYFSLHAAALNFERSPSYRELLGGYFVGHDSVKTFRVETHDAWYGHDTDQPDPHPVASGVDSFDTLDELYLMQTTTPDIKVIARAEYHPVMWSRQVGEGRVLVLTLGHGPYSVRNPGYQTLLINGVRWLGRDEQQ